MIDCLVCNKRHRASSLVFARHRAEHIALGGRDPGVVIRARVGPRNATTDNDGRRYYSWQGRQLPSVTTIRALAGTPFGLHNWAISQVVNRAVDGIIDLFGRRILDADGKGAKTWLRAAATEERDKSAKRGTAVHDAAAAGMKLEDADDEIRPFLAQYYDWLEKSQAYIIASERQVWNLTVGYAGTFDLLCQLPDGGIRMIDLKTGKGLYPEHGLQAMAYAKAEFVGNDDEIDDRLTRLLHRVSHIGILHLAADGWEYVELDADLNDEDSPLWVAFQGLLDFSVWMEAHGDMDTLIKSREKGAA